MKKRVVMCCIGLVCGIFSSSAFSADIYLTRHFEKQAAKQDPELTDKGQQRAVALAELLKDTPLEVIYSTDYRRTKQTAQPLAEVLGKQVTLYDPSHMKRFIQTVTASGQSALIVGHSNTTPVAIKLLGGEAKMISESDYGELFKVTLSQDTVTTSSQMVNID